MAISGRMLGMTNTNDSDEERKRWKLNRTFRKVDETTELLHLDGGDEILPLYSDRQGHPTYTPSAVSQR